MHKIDTTGATEDNEFTDGNPLTGTPATVVGAKWLNTLQREMIAILVEAGITPDDSVDDQVLQAIIVIAAGGGSAVTAAAVSVLDSAEYFDGINVEAVLAEIGEYIQDAATSTMAANRIRRSVIALTGSANNMANTHYENVVEVSHSSATTYTILADGTLASPIGTCITIFQEGAGQVEVVAAGGVTLKKPSSFNAKTMEQHASLVIIKTAANTWRIGSMMEAAA